MSKLSKKFKFKLLYRNKIKKGNYKLTDINYATYGYLPTFIK